MGYDQPGFKIPCPGPNELRPNARNAEADKGPLRFVTPQRMVMDFGGKPGTSATFVREGRSSGKAKEVPRDAPIHPGIASVDRRKKYTGRA